MRSGQGPQDAGVSALTAFLAAGAIAVIAILAVMVAVMSGSGAIPDNGTGATPQATVTNPANATNLPDVTPTPSPVPTPHKLRIVAGKGIDLVPTPTPEPDGGMYFDDGIDRSARHIAFAFQPNVSGIADFTAYWTIPERPQYDGGPKHTVFLWVGIQQGDKGLIQCVLEWYHDHTGKYWTLACWAVNARDGTYDYSRRIDAYPGDRIKAELRYEADPYDPGRKVWHLIMTDETHEVSTDLIDRKGAVDTNLDVIVFSGVLEGTGEVTNSNDLPGDVMFGNISYKNEYGQDMPIYLSGNVDDRFGHVAVEYEDGPSGSPVIIRTNYSE